MSYFSSGRGAESSFPHIPFCLLKLSVRQTLVQNLADQEEVIVLFQLPWKEFLMPAVSLMLCLLERHEQELE